MATINPIGKALALSFLSVLLLVADTNAAAVITLDRHQITVDDTFVLTIRVTEGEDLDDIDLAPLKSNFDILGRSQNSRHIFGNGGNESWSELALTMAPRHTGTLYIPALAVDDIKTAATQIIVRKAKPLPAGSPDTVFVEVETDKDSVYVQEQVTLTVKIFQSINLDNPSISELKLENSFVEQISQNSGQRRLNNTPYLVHEIIYAIFPQKSGELKIPSLTFSGTQLNRRRSLFDMGGQGKIVRKQTEAKTVTVKPIPDKLGNNNWLPAEQLTLEESWSTQPENLAVGESTTRTLTIRAKGLLSEQLPPNGPPTIDGVKFYPDQPKLRNENNKLGSSSERIDSSAMVITRAGEFRIPETKIPWWDTNNKTIRWASIPSRTIKVSAGKKGEITNNAPLAITSITPITEKQEVVNLISQDAVRNTGNIRIWQILSATFALAWLITLTLAFRLKKHNSSARNTDNLKNNETEKGLFRRLSKACKENDPKLQRTLIIDWAQSYWQDPSISTLREVSNKINDLDISNLLKELDLSIYSHNENKWHSADFIEGLRHHKKGQQMSTKKASKLRPLYPSAG